MRSLAYIKLLFLLFFIVSSCNFSDYIGAGTVGRIQHYDFQYPYKELNKRLDYELLKNKNMEMVDSDQYFDLVTSDSDKEDPLIEDCREYDRKFSYLSINYNNEKIIFRYKLRDMESFSRITLVSATKYGRELDISRNIPRSKRKRYKKIFEEELIDKLEK